MPPGAGGPRRLTPPAPCLAVQLRDRRAGDGGGGDRGCGERSRAHARLGTDDASMWRCRWRRCRRRPPRRSTITADRSRRQRRRGAAPLAFQTPPAVAAARDHGGARATPPVRSPGRNTSSCAISAPSRCRSPACALEDGKGGDDLPDETLRGRRLRAGRAVHLCAGQGATRRRAPGRCWCASTRASAPTVCQRRRSGAPHARGRRRRVELRRLGRGVAASWSGKAVHRLVQTRVRRRAGLEPDAPGRRRRDARPARSLSGLWL